MCKLPTDPRPEPYPTGHALFLLENRTDFGPGLWDRFLGGERLRCVNVPGNHFTMMKAPHVSDPWIVVVVGAWMTNLPCVG